MAAAAPIPPSSSVNWLAIADKAQKDFRAITATSYEVGRYGGSTVSNWGLYVRWTCIVVSSGLAVCIVAAVGSDKMGIGTLGGWMFGATAVNVHDFVRDFLAWKQRAQRSVVENVVQGLEDAGVKVDPQILCGINIAIPKKPVCSVPKMPLNVPHSPQIFEEEALTGWVSSHKTCPMTRQPMSLSDIQPASLRGQVAPYLVCLDVIRRPEVQRNAKEKQKQGLLRLEQHCNQVIQHFFLPELDAIRNELTGGKITLGAFHKKTVAALEKATAPVDMEDSSVSLPASNADQKRSV